MRTYLLSFILLAVSGSVYAEGRHPKLIAADKSVEAVELQLSNATGNGYVLAKECQTCQQVHLNVTLHTQAYFNNKPVPLSQVPGYITTPSTVVYDPKTMNANRIYW